MSKVSIKMMGKKYSVFTEDSPEYVMSLAEKLDADLMNLKRSHPGLPAMDLMMLISLNYLDQALENTVSDISDENTDELSHKLVECMEELDALKKTNEELSHAGERAEQLESEKDELIEKLSDFDRLSEENEKLRSALAKLMNVKEENEALKKELEALKSAPAEAEKEGAESDNSPCEECCDEPFSEEIAEEAPAEEEEISLGGWRPEIITNLSTDEEESCEENSCVEAENEENSQPKTHRIHKVTVVRKSEQ